MEVLGKNLVEGTFYHALSEHLDFDDVWYSNGRSLINPRNKDHGHCIDMVWAYYPLTVEETAAFTNWMLLHGDEAGRKAWDKYKEKLIKGAGMAENSNTEKRKEVNLYDSKFVHFDWDESLKDKKGFYCDNIDELRADVLNNGQIGLCDQLGDPSFPFHINGVSTFRFFYYDPNYKVKWAYFKEGKNVQFKSECDGEWEDIRPWSETVVVDGPEYFDDNYEYRIKPEEEPKVEVNVDVKVNNSSSDNKIKITINGKECVFENAEQARMVLKG